MKTAIISERSLERASFGESRSRAGGLPPDPSIGSIEPQSDASAAAQPAAASNAVITGEVDVSPEMKSKIRPDDTVFVYARPIEGSKMPVAFASYKGKDLPIKFRLDAQSQMGMGMKTLADVKEAYVEARVSRSGNFTRRSSMTVWRGSCGCWHFCRSIIFSA